MEHLKELRNKKGLLQKEIAQHLCIDRTTYVKYELGTSEPDFKTLNKIADFFGVSIDYLLGRDSIPSRDTPPKSELDEAYDAASDDIKSAVRKLLDME